jgi:hypothetical protein
MEKHVTFPSPVVPSGQQFTSDQHTEKLLLPSKVWQAGRGRVYTDMIPIKQDWRYISMSM